MSYLIGMSIVQLLFRVLSRIKVQHLERIPKGSYIAVSNHIGRLDAGLVYYFLKRKDIIMMVAEKYKKYAMYRWLVKTFDGIWVDRFNADLNAMREVMRRLKQGGVLVLAPEGTRSPNGALQQGWDGASYLAAKLGLPILPVGVTGTEDSQIKKRWLHFKRLDIHGYVGEIFTLPPLPPGISGKERDALLHQYTDEIMCQIAAVLPEMYRGVYAEHPRTAELLAAQARTQGQQHGFN
jgi:1-acyl-sn-glycerol-3-phosphate acyltransferase